MDQVDTKFPKRFLKLTAKSTEKDAMKAYDEWAKSYEEDTEKVGYKGHMLCLEGFQSIVGKLSQEKENIRIMDAGAGTGIIGEYLKQQGYTNVDGLDISQEMLDIAKQKNVYKKLICAPLSEKKISEVPTEEYHVLLSAGTIVYGQVEAGALEEIARMVKPGGFVVFTIRTEAFDNESYGYSNKCDELEKAKKWELVSREKRVLYAQLDDDKYNLCYLITYKVLNN